MGAMSEKGVDKPVNRQQDAFTKWVVMQSLGIVNSRRLETRYGNTNTRKELYSRNVRELEIAFNIPVDHSIVDESWELATKEAIPSAEKLGAVVSNPRPPRFCIEAARRYLNDLIVV